METDAFVIELSDGREVELRQCWDISETDSYSSVEIWDCENNSLLKSYRGSLPNFDDEDFDMDKFIEEVEKEL